MTAFHSRTCRPPPLLRQAIGAHFSSIMAQFVCSASLRRHSSSTWRQLCAGRGPRLAPASHLAVAGSRASVSRPAELPCPVSSPGSSALRRPPAILATAICLTHVARPVRAGLPLRRASWVIPGRVGRDPRPDPRSSSTSPAAERGGSEATTARRQNGGAVRCGVVRCGARVHVHVRTRAVPLHWQARVDVGPPLAAAAARLPAACPSAAGPPPTVAAA